MKKGDIIENKDGKRKILEILGCLVFPSQLDNFTEADSYYTQKELEEDGYKVVESEWGPEVGKPYWYITVFGKSDDSTWGDDEVDNARKNFIGIFKTQAEAQKRVEEIRKLNNK